MGKRLRLGQGNPVSGTNFWDRKEEMALLISHINDGANVLLVAQRRMGKTSLMREAALRLSNEYTCLFVDLQNCQSAPEAITELSVMAHRHESLSNKITQLFANALGGLANRIESIGVSEFNIKLRGSITEGDWREKGDRLFDVLAAVDKPVLLLLDEVPILVSRLLKGSDYQITPERRLRTDEFVSWLRRNAIRHAGKVRMVISGSIGLEPVLKQAGLSATLNTYTPFELPPWSDEAAIGCLEALGREYAIEFPDGAPEAIVETLGFCVPHHVQMAFVLLRDQCVRAGRKEFLADQVPALYEEMHGPRRMAELHHYEERLKMVLDPQTYTMACDMLTEASLQGFLDANTIQLLAATCACEGRVASDVQREIVEVLEHDGYLKRSAETYIFVSNLIRDWWKARHSLYYVPVANRKG